MTRREGLSTDTAYLRDQASEGQPAARRDAIDQRFAAAGGSLALTTDAGCFVARSPRQTKT